MGKEVAMFTFTDLQRRRESSGLVPRRTREEMAGIIAQDLERAGYRNRRNSLRAEIKSALNELLNEE
jgi:hypothetical protein